MGISSKTFDIVDEELRRIELTSEFEVSKIKLDGLNPYITFKKIKKATENNYNEEIKYTFPKKYFERVGITNINKIVGNCRDIFKLDNNYRMINLNISPMKVKGEFYNMDNGIKIGISVLRDMYDF